MSTTISAGRVPPPVTQNVNPSIPLDDLWRHLPADTRLLMARTLGRLLSQKLGAAPVGKEADHERH
jgi:hypothetical protein